MTEIESSQTTLSDMMDDIVLGVSDIENNEVITILEDDTHSVIRKEQKTTKEQDGSERKYKEFTVLAKTKKCTARLRINNQVLKTIVLWSNGDDSKVKDSKWTAIKVGQGSYATIQLTPVS